MILNPVPKCADSSRKQTKPHEALDGRLGCDHIPIFRPNFLQGLRTKVCVSKQSLDQIIDIKKMLGCCGGWWLFVGVGWKAPFLPLDQLPIGCGVRCKMAANSMLGGLSPPWSMFILGLRCFLEKFCGL